MFDEKVRTLEVTFKPSKHECKRTFVAHLAYRIQYTEFSDPAIFRLSVKKHIL